VTCAATGVVPIGSRMARKGSTREISALARELFNAGMAGGLFAGKINLRIPAERDRMYQTPPEARINRHFAVLPTWSWAVMIPSIKAVGELCLPGK